MSHIQGPRHFEHRRRLCVRTALVASLIAIADTSWPDSLRAADEGQAPPRARFRDVAPWLPTELLSVDKVIAFEEHTHFVYLAGRPSAPQGVSGTDRPADSSIRLILLRPATVVADVWPLGAKHGDLGKPTATSTMEVSSASGNASKRAVFVYRSPADASTSGTESIRAEGNVWRVAVTEGDRRFHLRLPGAHGEPARIAVESTNGTTILPERQLPAGILPYGPDGMQLIERWDSRYRADSRPAWDKGFPSTHLKAAVEGGVIKPVRAVVLGCGTGTNAVFLARQGFDVTAIDIAPTALRLAEEKAEKAGVRVRWLLADVLSPPDDLETFDFVFDRGCYHGVRQGDAQGYVEAVKRLSRPGSQIFILAGNANEERHYGPPRVKEEELRDDFSSDFQFVQLKTVHFDSADPEEQGALAWSVLLLRKDKG